VTLFPSGSGRHQQSVLPHTSVFACFFLPSLALDPFQLSALAPSHLFHHLSLSLSSLSTIPSPPRRALRPVPSLLVPALLFQFHPLPPISTSLPLSSPTPHSSLGVSVWEREEEGAAGLAARLAEGTCCIQYKRAARYTTLLPSRLPSLYSSTSSRLPGSQPAAGYTTSFALPTYNPQAVSARPRTAGE
jgi:hypothetical protein